MGRASDRRDADAATTETLLSSTLGSREEPQRRQRLLLSAVQRGLWLDDAWRHAFLRSRWLGK